MEKYFVGSENKRIYMEMLDGTISPTVFDADGEKVLCSLCGEELGEFTDENLEHQSEYHNCPC